MIKKLANMWSSKYDISFGSPSKIGFLDKFPNYKWKISALGELGPSCWLFNLSRGGNPLRELALIGPFSVCFPKGGTTTPRAILTGHDYEITCAAVCAELGLVLSGSTGKSVCGTFVKRVCAVWGHRPRSGTPRPRTTSSCRTGQRRGFRLAALRCSAHGREAAARSTLCPCSFPGLWPAGSHLAPERDP